MPLYATSGTLAGVAVTIDPFGQGGPTTNYTEVHNLSHINTYTCLAVGVTFSIPPLRKLVISDPLTALTLNGTGAYTVIANTQPQIDAPSPSLQPTYYGTGVLVSSADGVTIEDTGSVIRVKDLGISTAKLADLAVATGKIADLAVTSGKLADSSVSNDKLQGLSVSWTKINSGSTSAGTPGSAAFTFIGNPADGETVTVEYGTAVVYEFDNGGGVAPGNIAVTIGAGAAATLINLKAAIALNQPNVHTVILAAAVDSLGIVGYNQSYTLSGEPLTLLGSASVAVYNAKSAFGEYKQGVLGATYTVTVDDAAAGSVIFGVGGLVESYTVQVFTGAGVVKAFDGFATVSGPSIEVSNFMAAVPFVAGDVITMMAVVNY